MMDWFNRSVKKYTNVVESKLLKLVEDCLKRQETLERKLNDYENANENNEEIQDRQGDAEYCPRKDSLKRKCLFPSKR